MEVSGSQHAAAAHARRSDATVHWSLPVQQYCSRRGDHGETSEHGRRSGICRAEEGRDGVLVRADDGMGGKSLLKH